jgi:hypothetical protein
MRRKRFFVVVLLGAACVGCETVQSATCDPSAAANPEQTVLGPKPVNGVYMSSSWDGELLNFQGGTHYALKHGLGCQPTWVQTYLSFDQYGTADQGSGPGSIAQSAGNQVVILGVDCTYIHVANDSCVDYWLLAVAGGAPTSCGCPAP